MAIVYGTNGSAEDFLVVPGTSIEGFEHNLDDLVLPAGTELSTVTVTVDHDWANPNADGTYAWGQRVSWGSAGESAFLRYSWEFDPATDADVASGGTTPPTTSGIIYGQPGVAEDFTVAGSAVAIEGFEHGVDDLVLPAGTDPSTISVVADQDWAHQNPDGSYAWGQRVSWGDAGENVFLRYSWEFDPATDAEVAGGTPPTDPPPDGQFREILTDDFDGTTLDRSIWQNVYGGGTYWNNAFEWDPSQVNVADGNLVVSMSRDTDGDGLWQVGGLNMEYAGSITYGRVEFTARVEEEQGTGTAILMWPTGSTQWPPEIDILETPNTTAMHTLHWQGPNGNGDNQSDSQFSNGLDTSQWHTYRMDWTPQELGIYVDGQKVASWTDHIPDSPMSFGVMGYVAGQNDWFDAPPDASTPDQVNIYLGKVTVSEWIG
ncbi:glycoside hydrolase family 16 protein [Siccirubricoccus sp. KC 17139]|uniref:Glycoside hydrolase family 16 protein n=1 Tax=Siccirubricoccus soli TaxID=2899147 RepID=A0ABT1D809_9PROT|nr:glycoside hydrolase family 16 protein [Siccirubricoccus soli]MCO6418077.1 glycoside hydrolase family 16 protein [Siccirubricoccus soli]MCP2684212.1 glycoside hydrolase family 16 protein [Siccirubricoccus soli]